MTKDEWHPIEGELCRTYLYPDKTTLTFEKVVALKVSTSGTHYLALLSGQKAIILPGWRAVHLDATAWSI